MNVHQTKQSGSAFAPISRRAFMAGAAIAATGLSPRSTQAIDPFPRTRPSHLKFSLAAFSYKPYLTGEKSPRMDLFRFVDLAADLQVDAVELTSYYFPENVEPEY